MNGPEHFLDIEPEEPVYELPSWDLPGRKPTRRRPDGDPTRKRAPRKVVEADTAGEEMPQ